MRFHCFEDIERNNMKQKMNFSLEEIANWGQEGSKVIIPAIQRGLVWKPVQVELLWDSLLRGFPIGSFMLSESSNEIYDLIDGQQRYNAICLGFSTIKKAKAVIWIDCNPSTHTNTTRKIWIRATTESHPWGFKDDDQCSVLKTWERREAVKTYNLGNSNIYNDEISLCDTWPIYANAPIPLFILLNANTNSPESFFEDIYSYFSSSDFAFRIKINYTEEIRKYIKDILYPYFLKVHSYKINCNLLSREILERETQDDQDQTALELLFNRLNTGGTAISKEDLTYSSIKAYWPHIKEENDRLATLFMPPSKLVTLAFRLALTQDGTKLRGGISPQQIRAISHKPELCKLIDELYDTTLGPSLIERILQRIDQWLGVKDNGNLKTPAHLRTSIVQSNTELYLLLMYLARKEELSPEQFQVSYLEMRSLAFTIHWFSNDPNKCVQAIFSRCNNLVTLHNLLQGVSRCQHDCLLLHIYSPEEVKGFFEIKHSSRWRWQDGGNHWTEFYWRIHNHDTAHEMLLYAQREYINSNFSKYDPARKDMWESYNRPWDMDHIIPQDWFNGKRGEYREYDKPWLWSIGNFAAISYEINRGKGNRICYDDYKIHANKLLFEPDFEEVAKAEQSITFDKQKSIMFASIVAKRVIKIYERVYPLIEPLTGTVELSATLQRRKELFLSIIKKDPRAKVFFVAGNNVEYEVVRDNDWAREWLGIGFIEGDCNACFEWAGYIDNQGNPRDAEIGIRKAPGTSINNEKRVLFDDLIKEGYDTSSSGWWYALKTVTKLDPEIILSTLQSLEVKMQNDTEPTTH